MFNLDAFIRLINTNNDNTIQQSEIKDFIAAKNNSSPSIFTEYFDSINSDVSIEIFKTDLNEIITKAGEAGNNEFKLNLNEEEQEIYSALYDMLGYRFKSDEDFDTAFNEIFSECKEEEELYTKIQEGLIEKSSSTSPVDWFARLNTGAFYTTGPDFQNIIFDDIDLSAYPNAFAHICFNEKTFSKVSPEHLPPGFNPLEVLEKGKTIGLGIAYAHTQMNHGNGYTGEGVNYAIIDSGAMCENGHEHNGLVFQQYYIAPSGDETDNHFHGMAVSHIAQDIAPQANLYYYAANNGGGEAQDREVLENLRAILELNQSLPDDQKIRVISMSMPLYGGEEAKQIVAELESQGCWVITSGKNGDSKKFGYLEKIDPNGDVDDFNNYQIASENRSKQFDNLYINSGNRTLPDPSEENSYRHDSAASQSWAIPVLAGYYVLACQADPTMNKTKFYRLANQTARVVESTEPIYDREDDNRKFIGRTSYKIQIKIIDIDALLQAIEAESGK